MDPNNHHPSLESLEEMGIKNYATIEEFKQEMKSIVRHLEYEIVGRGSIFGYMFKFTFSDLSSPKPTISVEYEGQVTPKIIDIISIDENWGEYFLELPELVEIVESMMEGNDE